MSGRDPRGEVGKVGGGGGGAPVVAQGLAQEDWRAFADGVDAVVFAPVIEQVARVEKVVLAQGPLAQVADEGAGAGRHQGRAQAAEHLGQHHGHGVGCAGWGSGRRRAAQGLAEALEEGPVGVDRAPGPHRAGDRGDHRVGRQRDARSLGYVQLGHPDQLLDAHTHQRIEVGLGSALGGDGGGQLGRLAPRVAGGAAQEPPQVEERQVPARVVVTGHQFSVDRCGR